MHKERSKRRWLRGLLGGSGGLDHETDDVGTSFMYGRARGGSRLYSPG